MAILTVAANRTVAAVHDRMPAIIGPLDYDAWLDCRSGESLGVAKLVAPAADDLLEVIEVDRRLSDPRNEGPQSVLPVAPQLML